jgi:CheY-like chemotaxis protein
MAQSVPQKPSTPADKSPPRLNSLRLDDRALNTILDKLEHEGPGESAGKAARTYVRWPFRHTTIGVEMTHPGGSVAKVTMACRNLSCGGVALLHNSYIHTGTEVSVSLPHPFRGEVSLKGIVTRCRHRGGLLHEVGVKFGEQINIREFIRPDPFKEYFSLERVNPAELRGTLLYVEDSLLDQRIVKHYLRDSSMSLKCVTTAGEAVVIAKQGVDLILCDFHLPDGAGSNFVNDIREAGVAAAVIMVTSDNSSMTRAKVRDSNADAFLAKPLTQDRVLRAIAEFLLVDKPSGIMSSSLKGDDPMFGLIHGFVDQLHDLSKQLQECIDKDDAETCAKICQQIRGTAPVLGFEPIGRMADRASELVARTGSVKESGRAVQELVGACSRVMSDGSM